MARYSKEDALSVLSRYSDMSRRERGYWEAIINETIPNFYLEGFKRRRDDYSDELPDVDVRTLPEPQGERMHVYKCQSNYVLGLCSSLRGAVEKGIITDSGTADAVDGFLESDFNFQVGDPENSKRIQRINSILNLVIGDLEAQIGAES